MLNRKSMQFVSFHVDSSLQLYKFRLCSYIEKWKKEKDKKDFTWIDIITKQPGIEF